MYTEIDLAPEVRTVLESLDRPVRVLDGRAQHFTPPTSWAGHVRASSYSRPECDERGVTIVSWGSDEPFPDARHQLMYLPRIPLGLTLEPRTATLECGREWLQLPAGPESWRWDFVNFARIAERTVWYAVPLTPLVAGGLPWEQVDLYRFLTQPIEAALAAESRDARAARVAAAAAERERAEELRRERALTRARDVFTTAATQAGNQRLTLAKQQLEQTRHDQVNFQDQIRASMTRARALREQIAGIEAAGNGITPEQVAEQWDALVAHPKVVNVSASGENLMIETIGLDISHPDYGSGYLGRFNIVIPPASHGGITLSNLDNRKGRDGDRYDHPHVSGSYPCFGGSSSLVAELQEARSYQGLFEILIQYLETCNPGDTYASPGYWTNGYDEDEDEPDEDNCSCEDCRRSRGELD